MDILEQAAPGKEECFKLAKMSSDIEARHRHLVHLNYRNVITNEQKVIGMEDVEGPIPDILCELGMKSRQQVEPSRKL